MNCVSLSTSSIFAARAGHHIIGACRKPDDAKDLAALGSNVSVVELDLAEDKSIDAFVSKISDGKSDFAVDLLINNAGVLLRSKLGTVTSESLSTQLRTNAIGPFMLTQKLLPFLQNADGAKVVSVTSRMGSTQECSSGNNYGYRASKAALNNLFKCMSVDLAGGNIPVALIHPGWIRTGMTGNTGDMDADETAKKMTTIIDGLTMENSGRFWHRDGQELPW
jgi:NAD(P)-dependent dehydrogenase (short-subunit alcohol dehydrogenase family)